MMRKGQQQWNMGYKSTNLKTKSENSNSNIHCECALASAGCESLGLVIPAKFCWRLGNGLGTVKI